LNLACNGLNHIIFDQSLNEKDANTAKLSYDALPRHLVHIHYSKGA
jgi:hypothetical protein